MPWRVAYIIDAAPRLIEGRSRGAHNGPGASHSGDTQGARPLLGTTCLGNGGRTRRGCGIACADRAGPDEALRPQHDRRDMVVIGGVGLIPGQDQQAVVGLGPLQPKGLATMKEIVEKGH